MMMMIFKIFKKLFSRTRIFSNFNKSNKDRLSDNLIKFINVLRWKSKWGLSGFPINRCFKRFLSNYSKINWSGYMKLIVFISKIFKSFTKNHIPTTISFSFDIAFFRNFLIYYGRKLYFIIYAVIYWWFYTHCS